MSQIPSQVFPAVPDVFAVIEAAQSAADVDQLIAIMGPAFRRLGAQNFSYGQATDTRGARAPAVQFGLRHNGWVEHYTDRHLVAKDGMYQRTMQSTDPFTWAGVTGAGLVAPDGIEVLAQARTFGLYDGFIVPVHLLNGASAAVLMYGDTVFEWSPRERASAHLLAIYFSSIGRGLASAESNVVKPSLTRRQRECLQWVRAGKTDWEIAKILGLSEYTVIEYLEAARKRLGVRTRAQAVIEAISLGLISV